MCEWLKQAVLKTAVRETVPGVRIPLPPPVLGDLAVCSLDHVCAQTAWLREVHLKNKASNDRTGRNFWLLVSLVLVLATALAALWYVYAPDAPSTEHGHVQR
jgi:H+/Cl- antiporter ClcA